MHWQCVAAVFVAKSDCRCWNLEAAARDLPTFAIGAGCADDVCARDGSTSRVHPTTEASASRGPSHVQLTEASSSKSLSAVSIVAP